MTFKNIKKQIDAMSRPAFFILQASFLAAYISLGAALVWAVRICLAGGALPMSAYRAVDGFIRLPQAILLVGVLGSAIAEDVILRRR